MKKEKELIKAEFIEVLLNSNNLKQQLDGHLLQSSERIHEQLELLRNAVLLCDDINLKKQVYSFFVHLFGDIAKYRQDNVTTINPLIQNLKDLMEEAEEEDNALEEEEEMASSIPGLPDLEAMGKALCESSSDELRSDGRLMMITGALAQYLVNTLFKVLMEKKQDAFKELLLDLERRLDDLNE